MKKTGMLQILMIMVFVVEYGLASAQDYVVTITGDTIHGKVKYFNNTGVKYTAATNAKYVQITADNGKKSTHEVLETIGFRMKDEIYHTIKFEQSYTFMKLLKSGYLNLYSYQLANQTTWDGRYFVKKDGGLLDVPNLGFKKRVTKFLADCPDVVAKVEAGDLSRANLSDLVDQYNSCIHGKSNPVKSPAVAAWADLQAAVKALPDFDKKADALEMIQDILGKVARKENVPSFLMSGLKDSLKDQSTVADALDKALGKLNNN
jgi:hypothetical protein